MKLKLTFIACCGIPDEDNPSEKDITSKIKSYARIKSYPDVSRVYTGADTNCRETAAIIYPKLPALLAGGMKEFDFGIMSGKGRRELLSSTEFEKWAGSAEMLAFPRGELPYAYKARVLKEFGEIMDDLEHSNVEEAAIIVSKSAILIILNRYLPWAEGYRGINIAEGGGCTAIYDSEEGALGQIKVF